MKTKLIKLAAVMLVAALAILAVAPIEVASSEDGKTWMQKLDGDTKISEMTIPGTHDSGALHSIADVSGRCQTLGIGSQLNIGVRFFDIRLGQAGSELHVVHSFVDQAELFANVIDTMASFARAYPSEFLIVSIKEDLDAVNPTLPFSAAVMAALDKHTDVIDFSGSLPNTLGEARGKIYIMSRFKASYGIQMHSGWEDSATFEIGDIYVQDHYRISDVEHKITEIRSTAEITDLGIYRLVLNYTSCYLNNQAFPPTYAGTPAIEINQWLYNYLTDGSGNMGVVITDFMTERLASAIYGRNFR